VTGSDGRAHVVYTAPPPPPPATAGSGTRVTIVATAIGTNFQASSSQLVDIRLVPPGVILPPADTPTAAFTVSGTPADAGTTVFFDGSGSCGGPITAGVCSSASVVRSWAWNFGDGTAGASGVSASHKFANAADFIVTLTVTNDRGVTASVSQSVTIGSPTLPTAKFVFSPSSPAIGAGTNTVLFNADQSTAAPGHQITQFNWNFGDPSSASNTASGFTVTHVFNTPGAFTVVLSILDDLGQKATFSQTVNVVP
jgi:PKD repeat protein